MLLFKKITFCWGVAVHSQRGHGNRGSKWRLWESVYKVWVQQALLVIVYGVVIAEWELVFVRYTPNWGILLWSGIEFLSTNVERSEVLVQILIENVEELLV